MSRREIDPHDNIIAIVRELERRGPLPGLRTPRRIGSVNDNEPSPESPLAS